MNRALLSAAAVGAFAFAAPAFAQIGLGLGVGLDARIDQSLRAGAMSNNDALRLRGEARTLADLERRYAADGLQEWERRDLQTRHAALSARLGVDARGPGNGNAYGRGGPNGWANINGRQAELDARIDQGVRNGSLTNREAAQLRAEFRTIATLEDRYRATGGMDARERADLDRRFDALSARIRIERADNQGRGDRNDARNINARQAQLEARIDRAIRNRQLSPGEANRIRAEFRTVAMIESRYRADGLDRRERQDLDRRFDQLEARFRVELADRDFRWDGPRFF
jgi:hypothetical protein